MFREMRRKRQELPLEECESILQRGTSGVLALSGDDGYPYAVPLSYVYENGKLYFHSAKDGHKVDAVCRNPKASFCVVDKDCVMPESYTTYFRSVIVFGTIRILETDPEIRDAVQKLALKYAPEDTAVNRQKAIEQGWERLCMMEMTAEHISGKEAIELACQKKPPVSDSTIKQGGNCQISQGLNLAYKNKTGI